MERTQIAGYFHPTTAVVVDDNQTFLETLSINLEDGLVCQLFDDPLLAIQYITAAYQSKQLNPNSLLADNWDDLDDCDFATHNLKLNIDKIIAPLKNKDRFNEISVIVLDFSMPDLNGVEFIDLLNKTIGVHPFKIIMVTGEADQNLAVQLFNAGKIHKFLLKSQDNLDSLISDSIKEMQHLYHTEISSSIVSSLALTTAPCLVDPVFIEKFYRICQENKTIEYYLYENTGSFVLVDAEGKTNILAVCAISELGLYAELAEDAGVNAALVEQIKQGIVLPFFGSIDSFMEAEIDAWHANVYPAQQIRGKQVYYYSLINDTKICKSLAFIKIFSYGKFKEQKETKKLANVCNG